MENNDYIKYIKQSFELKNQKLYKEAIEVLYKVLSDDVDEKTTVEVISSIADLHFLLKNYDRAIEQYEKVLEIEPTHEHSQNKLYEIHFLLKEYNKALKLIQGICESSKKSLDFVKYFSVLLKLGRADEILKIYETLDDELKNDPDVLYIISLLDEKNKKEILIKVVEQSPTFTEAKFDLALIYYNEENYIDSEKLIDEILKIKKDPMSYYYKALMQIKRKDYFAAIDNFHLAIKLSKGRFQEFYLELAKAYMDVNWFDEAVQTLKKSITLCIQQNESRNTIDKRYLLLAWVFEKQKDYDNALFNLTLIDPLSYYKPQSDILRAVVMYKKGDIVQAKEKLELMYEQNPKVRDDLTLLDTLGSIYKDLRLDSKAIEFYEKHLEHYPDSIHTVSEYVDLLIDNENYDKAEELIEKYSGHGQIASFLNSRARIFYRKKDYDNAILALDKLIEYDKNSAESYYFKGLILNKKEEYKKALSLIVVALELNPQPAKYYAQAAVSNLGLGFYNDAMLYIKEAVEIEPNDLNYKKLAAGIAEKSGNIHESEFWNSIVRGSEKIIKNNKRF